MLAPFADLPGRSPIRCQAVRLAAMLATKTLDISRR